MRFAKSSADKQKKPDAGHLGDRCEFIPYHGHYNPHTLVTKNGELLQIIKIDGNLLARPCENLDGVHASVCSTIRQVIAGSGATEKFAFWLHTIRRRVPMLGSDVPAKSENTDDFPEYVDAIWEKSHRFGYNYQNDIYLTIIHDGQAIPLLDTKQPKIMFFPHLNRKVCNKYLDSVYPALDQMTLAILEGIRTQCSAHRLSLVERAISTTGKVARPQVFYSEPLEFLGTLLNLVPEQFPLPDVDLSVGLQTAQLAFGLNAIEARHKTTGKRHFATMFSLRQYVDMPVEAVDCVLQAPVEFVISQSFSFIPSAKALTHFKAQNKLFGMSGDIKSNDSFGINKILSYDQKRITDFVEHQTTVMIHTGDIRNLDGEVEKFLKRFSKLGLVLLREDVLTEECFWAQLPSNFEFIRRRTSLATEQVGGFCRLNRFHSGSYNKNHWGNYLVLLPTSVESPYFFNFHVGDNGHTILFDFNSFEDKMGKILEYFLLSQTRKLGARIFVFDRDQSARLLLNKIRGKYFPMTQLEKFDAREAVDKSPRLALNPFSLPHSNYNLSFLVAWCGLLISSHIQLDEESKSLLGEAVVKLYDLPDKERNLPSLVRLLGQSSVPLSEALGNWIENGEYAGLFDAVRDSLDMGVDIMGVDMTSALAKPAFALPLFSYLMHRIIDSIDGKPMVIVINEAWELLENDFFSPRLESLLEMLRQRNVMVMFTTSKPSTRQGTSTLSAIMSQAATRIYVPDEAPINYQLGDLGLDDHDALALLDMKRQKGDFLVKQDRESVQLHALLDELEDVTAIFMNDTKTIVSARGRFAGTPKDY